MSESPESGRSAAYDFLQTELAELPDQAARERVSAAAALGRATVSFTALSGRLAKATHGHFGIVDEYLDRLNNRLAQINTPPSTDPDAPPHPHAGLKSREAGIVLRYERLLIEEYRIKATPLFHQYHSETVRDIESGNIPTEHVVQKPMTEQVVPVKVVEPDHEWITTRGALPEDETIIIEEFDILGRQQLTRVAAPAKPAPAQPAPVAAVAAEPEPEKGPTASYWTPQLMRKAALINHEEIKIRSGQSLVDYITKTMIPQKDKLQEAISLGNGTHTQAMKSYLDMLGAQIQAANDKVREQMDARQQAHEKEIAHAKRSAPAPTLESLMANSEYTEQFRQDVHKGMAAATLKARDALAKMKAEPEQPKSWFSRVFTGVKEWFVGPAKDAAEAGLKFGRGWLSQKGDQIDSLVNGAAAALKQPRVQGAVAGLGALAIGGAIVGNALIGGKDDPLKTERIAQGSVATTLATRFQPAAVPPMLNPAPVAQAPQADVVPATPAAAVLTTAATPAAPVAADPAPAAEPASRIAASTVKVKPLKASFSEPLPTPVVKEPYTVTFNDGSSIKSLSGPDTWSRICQQGFDICKKLTNG